MITKARQQLTFSTNPSSGIQVSYNKSKEQLSFFGWYDQFVGIEGDSINFIDFCKSLGIEEKTLKKTLGIKSGIKSEIKPEIKSGTKSGKLEWGIPDEVKDRFKQKVDYQEELKEKIKEDKLT